MPFLFHSFFCYASIYYNLLLLIKSFYFSCSDLEKCTDTTKETTDKSTELFPVIGKVKKGIGRRLQAPLPKWFQDYYPFSKDVSAIDYKVDCLNHLLEEKVLDICKKSIENFFPVQRAAIPVIIDVLSCNNFHRGRDVCVSSPTGSGKTLSFVIPIVQTLINRVEVKLRAIIILPVRDLAQQVYKVLEDFAKPCGLKATLSVGHRSFQEDLNCIIKEVSPGKYRWLIDVLVTTPSRLIDLIHNCAGFDLSSLQILVLDEVDRLLDFDIEYNLVQEIDEAVYGAKGRVPCLCCSTETLDSSKGIRGCTCLVSGCSFQNYSPSWQPYIKLIFSATLAKDTDNLFKLNLFKPIVLMGIDSNNPTEAPLSKEKDVHKMAKNILPAELKEKFLIVPSMKKPLAFWYMITNLKYRRVLCFTRTIKHSRLLTDILKKVDSLKVFNISSKLSDESRSKVIEKFKNGDYDIIITTDIMARGIDIEGIDYVISYDVPFDEIQYVHRVGRTARAGRPGTAITILSHDQVKRFHILMRKIHLKEDLKTKITKMNIETRKLNKLKSKFRKASNLLRQENNLETWKKVKRKKAIAWKALGANKQSESSDKSLKQKQAK